MCIDNLNTDYLYSRLASMGDLNVSLLNSDNDKSV